MTLEGGNSAKLLPDPLARLIRSLQFILQLFLANLGEQFPQRRARLQAQRDQGFAGQWRRQRRFDGSTGLTRLAR